VHREIPEDPHLRSQWNALVEKMESPEVFYTHQWAWAMQRAYGSSLVPFLVLVYHEESLVGVAALATDPAHGACFLAASTADYCDLLSDPSKREALAEAVFSRLAEAGVERITLANLPADSATPRAIHLAAARYGYRLFLRHAYWCAQVQLGVDEARANLKSYILRKKTLRRHVNALGQEGVVTLSHLRSWNEVANVLDAFSVAHVARFLATGRISSLARLARRIFLEELGKTLSEPGWLTLTRLMVGDRPVAWNYGFQFRGSWFWYQPTFDSKIEQRSPGYCLLAKIIAEACDTPKLGLVDLGLGAEGYKERFANGARETLHATATSSFGSYSAAIARYRIAQGIKASPRLEGVVRAGMRRLGTAKRRFRNLGVRGFLAWGWKRFWTLLFSRDEVFFYQWAAAAAAAPPEALRLSAMDLETLAKATIEFEGEEETYDYLLRSARRLLIGKDLGFSLTDAQGMTVHLCWVGRFEGFYMDELSIRLDTPNPNAAMIFDCWTPGPVRGHGYYAAAITLLAQQLVREGRDPWIFSAASNQTSVSGLESSGFQKRYSLVRQKALMVQRVTKAPLPISPHVEAPVAPDPRGVL
jgi:CelD/BcsL family acetyltransferase involved in cellulose biosynthesis